MNAHSINIDAVRTAERVYRSCLIDEPADTSIRLKLAWCLLIQAAHADGRQTILQQGHCGTMTSSQSMRTREYEDVGYLLEDCLRQTTAVLHLSRDASERADVEVLQNLIGIAAADAEQNPVLEESKRRIREITHAIVADSYAAGLPPKPRFRRVGVRRSR